MTVYVGVPLSASPRLCGSPAFHYSLFSISYLSPLPLIIHPDQVVAYILAGAAYALHQVLHLYLRCEGQLPRTLHPQRIAALIGIQRDPAAAQGHATAQQDCD